MAGDTEVLFEAPRAVAARMRRVARRREEFAERRLRMRNRASWLDKLITIQLVNYMIALPYVRLPQLNKGRHTSHDLSIPVVHREQPRKLMRV